MRIEITSNKLPGLSAALKKSLARVVEATAAQVEGDAKQKVPVDTGYLRSSITHEVTGLEGEVSVGADYGAHVEFGTEYHSPQPFLRPALTEAQTDFERRIREVIEEIAQ